VRFGDGLARVAIGQCYDPETEQCCTGPSPPPDPNPTAWICAKDDYSCGSTTTKICECLRPCGDFGCCSTSRDEICVDPEAGTCCAKTRACGSGCCPDGQKCVDKAHESCCPIDTVACYGALGSYTCCKPDEECCAGTVTQAVDCCGKGAVCDHEHGTCSCKPGTKKCQSANTRSGISQTCCHQLFEQCCKTGNFNHCEPITYTCCGQTSCPPDKVCCGGVGCFDPSDERCCGIGTCGLAEDCCRDNARGCCPAGTYCCGGGCCNRAGKAVASRRPYRSSWVAHERRGRTPRRRRTRSG
jgi:hypothetical protein